MSTLNTKAAPICTEARARSSAIRAAAICVAAGAFAFASDASAEWKIDLSRRQKAVRDADLQAAGSADRSPASAGAAVDSYAVDGRAKGLLNTLFEAGDPTQEIVLLSTDRGFVPSSLRLRKGSRYVIHVVNVNEKEKNVSFVLDSFGEHHATYYGKLKSFRLEPKKEGIYSFQCPETSAEGRVVVFSPQGSAGGAPAVRAPASDAMGFPADAANAAADSSLDSRAGVGAQP